ANVSVRERGETAFRTKTELKNMNSFKFVADGIARELERQVEVYESGGEVVQETLHYDPATGTVAPLRSKEYADDYRYFPEPDLVAIQPPPALIEAAREGIGELPGARIRSLEPTLGFSLAAELVAAGRDAHLDPIIRYGVEPREAANFLMNDLKPQPGVTPDYAGVAEAVRKRRELPPDVYLKAAAAASIADSATLSVLLDQTAISDASELDPVLDRVLADNQQQVDAYKGGKEGVLGFLVGQVMRETNGKANP